MRLLTAVMLAAMLGTASAASVPNPVLGTWKLNMRKSHFSPGPSPQSQTRTYSPAADGMTVSTSTVGADGKSSTRTFPARYDGKPFPVTGFDAVTAMALKKVDERTAEISLRHADKVIPTAKRIVSGDGKTMAITYERPGADPAIHNVSIYDKQ